MDRVVVRVRRDVAETLAEMTGAGSFAEAIEIALEPLADAVADALTDPDFIRARIILLRTMAKTLRARASELERQAETLERELEGMASDDVASLFKKLNEVIIECGYDIECVRNKARPLIEDIESRVRMPRGWLVDQIELVRKTSP